MMNIWQIDLLPIQHFTKYRGELPISGGRRKICFIAEYQLTAALKNKNPAGEDSFIL